MNGIRTIRRLGATLALGLAPLGAAACASSGASGPEAGGMAVEVQNDLIPPTSLSVYLVPDVGARRLIGVVEPGGNRVLRFDPPMASGQFRFLAEPTAGSAIVSNPLNIPRGATVRWDLSANIATVVGG